MSASCWFWLRQPDGCCLALALWCEVYPTKLFGPLVKTLEIALPVVSWILLGLRALLGIAHECSTHNHHHMSSGQNQYASCPAAQAQQIPMNHNWGTSTDLRSVLSSDLEPAHIVSRPHPVSDISRAVLCLYQFGFIIGNIVNKPEHGSLDWVKICEKSSKVITFIDLAGHERYLKTTVFGMTGHAPDFGMLMRLACSPPTKANCVLSLAGSPDFRKWESFRMMPLVGGFSRGSPIFPVPSFWCRSIFISITLIGSEDLNVGANAGIVGMTKEHLGLALALSVPVFVVVTKIDMCPPNVLQDTLKLLVRILKSPGCRKVPVMVKTSDDVIISATNFVSERFIFCLFLSNPIGNQTRFTLVGGKHSSGCITAAPQCSSQLSQKKTMYALEVSWDYSLPVMDKLCPIFQVSNVTGENLDLLKMFLNLLMTRQVSRDDEPAEFQIDDLYSVPILCSTAGHGRGSLLLKLSPRSSDWAPFGRSLQDGGGRRHCCRYRAGSLPNSDPALGKHADRCDSLTDPWTLVYLGVRRSSAVSAPDDWRAAGDVKCCNCSGCLSLLGGRLASNQGQARPRGCSSPCRISSTTGIAGGLNSYGIEVLLTAVVERGLQVELPSKEYNALFNLLHTPPFREYCRRQELCHLLFSSSHKESSGQSGDWFQLRDQKLREEERCAAERERERRKDARMPRCLLGIHFPSHQMCKGRVHASLACEVMALPAEMESTGVGTVVSGTTLKGVIRLNDTLLLGPDPLGHFIPIAVKSIHRKRMVVREVRGGQTASFALKKYIYFNPDESRTPPTCTRMLWAATNPGGHPNTWISVAQARRPPLLRAESLQAVSRLRARPSATEHSRSREMTRGFLPPLRPRARGMSRHKPPHPPAPPSHLSFGLYKSVRDRAHKLFLEVPRARSTTSSTGASSDLQVFSSLPEAAPIVDNSHQPPPVASTIAVTSGFGDANNYHYQKLLLQPS
ncbi:hypothetical protein PR048_009347 [Dryococelus australis]|uniref:GTP-binding protein 2 n=1 Tax=Dryococelus australis TaxID=614101 RepID=A0ABQ9HZM0_9NEOP|nr:hypothetical protein PR048_009347 [Dryococelus australis]